MSGFSAWETGLIHIYTLHHCPVPVPFTLAIHYVYCYLVVTSSRILTLLKLISSLHHIGSGTVLDTEFSIQHNVQFI